MGLGTGAVGEHTGGTHVSVKEVGDSDSSSSSIRFYSVFFFSPIFCTFFFLFSSVVDSVLVFLQRRMVEIVRQQQDVAAQEVCKS